MGRVVFLNANNPEQPASGVYRWFYLTDNREVTFYVGSSGRKQKQTGNPGTLGRATSHLQAAYPNYKDPKPELDTDFIVGTTIKFLKSKGVVCFWQHLSNDPKDEIPLIKNYKPKLVNQKGHIKSDIKKRNDGEKWKAGQKEQAESWLFKKFNALSL